MTNINNITATIWTCQNSKDQDKKYEFYLIINQLDDIRLEHKKDSLKSLQCYQNLADIEYKL